MRSASPVLAPPASSSPQRAGPSSRRGGVSCYAELSDDELRRLRQEVIDDADRRATRRLAWGEDLPSLCRELIAELETDNQRIDREIKEVSAKHVSEAHELIGMLENDLQPDGQIDKLQKYFDEIDDRLKAEMCDVADFRVLKQLHNTLRSVRWVHTVSTTLLSMREKREQWLSQLRPSGRRGDGTRPGDDAPPQIYDVYFQIREVLAFAIDLRSKDRLASNFDEYFRILDELLIGIVCNMRELCCGLMSFALRLLDLAGNRSRIGELMSVHSRQVRAAMDIVHAESEQPLISRGWGENADIFGGGGGEDSEEHGQKERIQLMCAQAGSMGGGLMDLVLLWVQRGTKRAWARFLDIPESVSTAERSALRDGTLTIRGLFHVPGGKLVSWVRAFRNFLYYIVVDGNEAELREDEQLWADPDVCPWGSRRAAMRVAGAATVQAHSLVQKMVGDCKTHVQSIAPGRAAEAVPDILTLVKWTQVYEKQMRDIFAAGSIYHWADSGLGRCSEYPASLLDDPSQAHAAHGAETLEGYRRQLMSTAVSSMNSFFVEVAKGRALRVRQIPEVKRQSLHGRNSTTGPTDLFSELREKSEDSLTAAASLDATGLQAASELADRVAEASAAAVETYCRSVAEECRRRSADSRAAAEAGGGKPEADERWLEALCALANDTQRCISETRMLFELFKGGSTALNASTASWFGSGPGKARLERSKDRALAACRAAGTEIADLIASFLVDLCSGELEALFAEGFQKTVDLYKPEFLGHYESGYNVSPPLATVLVTFADYHGDLLEWLDPEPAVHVVLALQYRACAEYVGAFARRLQDTKPLKLTEEVCQAVGDEIAALEGFFSRLPRPEIPEGDAPETGDGARARDGRARQQRAAERAVGALQSLRALIVPRGGGPMDAGTFMRAAEQALRHFPDLDCRFLALIADRLAGLKARDVEEGLQLAAGRTQPVEEPSIFAEVDVALPQDEKGGGALGFLYARRGRDKDKDKEKKERRRSMASIGSPPLLPVQEPDAAGGGPARSPPSPTMPAAMLVEEPVDGVCIGGTLDDFLAQ